MRRYLGCFLMMGILLVSVAADEKQTLDEVKKLFRGRNFSQALAVVNRGIEENGVTKDLMRWKFLVLRALDRNEEALEAALKKEEVSEVRSPWDCIDIVQTYLKLGKTESALDWLDEAVERGFKAYNSLKLEIYDPLKDSSRFKSAVARIKDFLGVGRPAPDFSAALLSGKKFKLSAFKGKVILIDFWAAWCGPCRREVPNLKRLYKEFKSRGFEIVGINMDSDEAPMRRFISRQKIEWNVVFSGKGWDDETAVLYGVNSIPSYWLVDRKGVLRHFGLRGEKLRNAVAGLVGEK